MPISLAPILAALLAAGPAIGSDPATAAEDAARAAAARPAEEDPSGESITGSTDARDGAGADQEPAAAAEPSTPDEIPADLRRMCEETICQHDVRITLKRADGSVFDRTYDVLPGVVQGEMLMIVAGQTLHLEMDVGEAGPTGWRVVETVRDPAITLTAKFEQMEEGGMMLHLKNPLDRSIKFRMGILPLDGDRLLATSSCPLSAKMGLFEMWPEPILQLMLADARFVGSDERVCE